MQASNHNLQFSRGIDIVDDIDFRTPSLKQKEQSQPPKKDDLLQWSIPPVHEKACMEMAHRLHNNHPTWSPEKVARKVAEKYKLKPAE